jgi:hypothetical protein
MAHKFKAIHAGNLYSVIVYCEKCGFVSYHTNRSDKMEGIQKEIMNGLHPCKYDNEIAITGTEDK